MDIGSPFDADTPRFYVVINGKRMSPYKGMPYRFTKERAEREIECTELNNKVMRENIRIEPVE